MELLLITVSFLIAILMGMGVGGGGLLVIFLTLCLNYNQILAQGTNLIFFIVVGVASMIFHIKKRKINLRQVLIIIIFGSFGSILFSYHANSINPEIPKKVMGALLTVSGFFTLYKVFIKKKN